MSDLKPCCSNLENREDGPGPRGCNEREGLTITHCRVCKCRHFEVTLDPGKFGLAGREL